MHRRRYRRRPLAALLHASGLSIEHIYYFNYFLFVPVYLARRLIDFLPNRLESENQVNSPLLNRVLSFVFSLDVKTAPALNVPFGVSIRARVAKPLGKHLASEPGP